MFLPSGSTAAVIVLEESPLLIPTLHNGTVEGEQDDNNTIAKSARTTAVAFIVNSILFIPFLFIMSIIYDMIDTKYIIKTSNYIKEHELILLI